MKQSSSRRYIFSAIFKYTAAVIVGAIYGGGRQAKSDDTIGNALHTNKKIQSIDTDISTSDGFKLIGSASSKNVREIEPTYDHQKIFLTNKPGTQKIPSADLQYDVLYYDAKDKESNDDGVFCFVTKNGKRWKRYNNGYLLFDWLDSDDVEDKSIVLQKAVDIVYDIAIQTGKAYELPIIIMRAGLYKMNSTVKLWPFVQIKTNGSITFDFSQSDTDGFIISTDNCFPQDKLKMPGNTAPSLNGTNGTISILGPGRTKSQHSALIIGNEKKSKSPCRDVKFNNLVITGWEWGNNYNVVDTFLTYFKDCRIEGNKGSLYIDGKANNSGERISYDNCVLAGTGDTCIFINSDSIDINFLNCSFDFIGNDILLLGEKSGYQCLRFIACHFEQWNGYVLNSNNKLTNITVVFDNVIFLPRASDKRIINSPSRELFNLNKGIHCRVTNFEVRHEHPALNDKIFMCADNDGVLDISGYIKDPFPQITIQKESIQEILFRNGAEENSTSDKLTGNGKIATEKNYLMINKGNGKNNSLIFESNNVEISQKDELNMWCCIKLANGFYPKLQYILSFLDNEKNVIVRKNIISNDFSQYENQELKKAIDRYNSKFLASNLEKIKIPNLSRFFKIEIQFLGGKEVTLLKLNYYLE